MAQHERKARASAETFDDFLASRGMLAACEERVLKEVIENGGVNLDEEQTRFILDLLDNPPKPNAKLLAAARALAAPK